MATYTKVFADPYPGGWKAKPDLSTPYTTSIRDNHDATLRSIEDYLYNNPLGDISDASINDLSDVAISNISNGQILVWDASLSKFVNGSAPSSDDGRIVSTNPSYGQVLMYNMGSSYGTISKYVNVDRGAINTVPGGLENSYLLGTIGQENNVGQPYTKIYTKKIVITNPTFDTVGSVSPGVVWNSSGYFALDAKLLFNNTGTSSYKFPMGSLFSTNDFIGLRIKGGNIEYLINGFSDYIRSSGQTIKLEITFTYESD